MSKQNKGRTFLQVPLNLRKQMAVTLSWIGEDLKLNLVAEIFSNTAAKTQYHCKAGYFNPECKGLAVLTPKDPKIMGETLKILPNAFVDNESGDVLKGQKILVYAATTGNSGKDSSLDIG